MTTDHNELRRLAKAVKAACSQLTTTLYLSTPDRIKAEMVASELSDAFSRADAFISSLTARAQAAEGEAERLAHHMDTCAHDELVEQNEAAWQALGMPDYEGEDDLAHFIAGIKGQIDALYNLAMTEANEFKDGTVIDTFKRVIAERNRLQSLLAEVAEAVKAECLSACRQAAAHYESDELAISKVDTHAIIARLVGQTTSRQEALADLRERYKQAALNEKVSGETGTDEDKAYNQAIDDVVAAFDALELEAKREDPR